MIWIAFLSGILIGFFAGIFAISVVALGKRAELEQEIMMLKDELKKNSRIKSKINDVN